MVECLNTPTDEELDQSNVEQVALQMLIQENIPINLEVQQWFKLVKGKDGTTSFLPIDDKIGGKISYIQNKEATCLTEEQASYVYKKVEEGNIINTKTMQCEIEQEIDREDDNPYKRVNLNKVYKDEDITYANGKLVHP